MIKLLRIVHRVASAIALLALCNSVVASDSITQRVLTEAQGAERPTWMAAQLQTEVRGRMARFDTSLLANLTRAATQVGRANSLTLDLFEDASFVIDVQRVETFGSEARFVVSGALTEAGRRTDGTALLSVVDGAIQAEFRTEDGRKFAIQHAGGDLVRISEMDPFAGIGECAFQSKEAQADNDPAIVQALQNTEGQSAMSKGDNRDSTRASAEAEPAVVDILIVYTSAFERALGGGAAAEARAQLSITAANHIFEASGIKSRVRLAHVAKVSYIEDTDMSVDLWRLADPTDGYLDEVAQLREQYAADVVHLFGQQEGFRRGQATGFPSDYYAVVISGDTAIFTHELGHNFGCQHDRAAAGTGGSSYAFGHVFTGEDERKYGCIMWYTGSAGALQLGRFSNPDISYRGTPTGIPKGRSDSADNARKVDLTAPLLASMRNADGSTSRIPVFANPPRLDFPMTSVGNTAPLSNLRLSFAGGSRARPLRVTDFQVTGDADSFLIQIWDSSAQQYLSGPDFTIPETGVTLFVRFRPVRNEIAEAAIRFNIDDPAYRYAPPPIRLVGNASAPLLKNISTRVNVGTGDDALIGGFIVAGNAPRPILVRAVGPSLTGIPGVLADPTIELYRGGELVAQNDEWVDGFPRELIKWTGVAPVRDLEPAILQTLEPGSYTAVVRGHNGGTGIGLVEAYDLEPLGGTHLVNISTRGRVAPGDGVMIGGFILGGATPSRVLVRALGPSLANAGVAGALGNPTVEIFNSQGSAIAANDDWRTDQQQAVDESGAAPSDDREAAALLTLQPGAYTAIVRGAGETSGIGLVEVYQLGPP